MRILRSKNKGELYPAKKLRGIGDCYNKPSKAKYEIYHSWLKWYKVTNMNDPFYMLRHFTINSYNCMMFTLSIDVYDMATDKFIGKLYITKNKARVLESSLVTFESVQLRHPCIADTNISK